MIRYTLPGGTEYQQQIYPDPALMVVPGLKTYEDVIAHFTRISLEQDLISVADGSLLVTSSPDGYVITFEPEAGQEAMAKAFANMHVEFLDGAHAGLALDGAKACAQTPAWNPMARFPVNRSDGPSVWLPCLPLGLPLVNQRAVVLMHYPPVVALRHADYFNNNTLRRWALLLECVGVADKTLYHSILDVNPIAAPGSGESEYQNDYFPINLTSMFFDDEARGLNYVRSMLELMLNPPANAANPYTLPLLVCGSPLYDPQAAGWFRVRYKDQMPRTEYGSPTADVLQAGFVKLNPASAKRTPYMVANHMIAAGVTGRCTDDPAKIPDIRKYEAQDLVAATFLGLCHDNPAIDPAEAKKQACRRWFGADNGDGAPNPPAEADKLTICALGQVDLCFNDKTLQPTYTFAEAKARCEKAGGPNFSPCFGCKPV